MNIIPKQVLSLLGFLILGIFPLFGQGTQIRALPPEDITATSFIIRASQNQPLPRFVGKGYVIDVATDSSFAEWTIIPGYRRRGISPSLSFLRPTVSELTPASTYFVRCVEVDSVNLAAPDKGFSNVQRVTTLDSPVPGSPDPRISSITKSGFTLHWNPVPKATYYLVDIWSLSRDYERKNIIMSKRIESTTFRIENLQDSVFDRYQYRVRAANEAGIGVENTCGECICIHNSGLFLRSKTIFAIDSTLDTKWALDALPFTRLPQSTRQDSSYISLSVSYYSGLAFTVLNKPDQERLLDTVWVEVEKEYRSQLTCGSSFSYNFPFPPSQLLLHLKRKEDVQYFIQQYGRDAVRYTWDFVPSSPMFYRYSLTSSTTTGTAGQTDDALNLAITPNPSTDIAAFSLSLPSASALRLTLHDALGREVRSIADGVYAAGEQEFSVALQGLPSGVYFLRCSVGGQAVVRRLAVVR